MPHPAPGARPRSAGFTLVEMLVVTLLIGIIASLVTLSVGDRALDDRLQREARRLEQLLQLAADQAVLAGQEYGFVHTGDGYAFVVRGQDGTWAPPVDAGPLRSRSVESPFFLEVEVEGHAVTPGEVQEDGAGLVPHVALLSSGEVTPFEIDLRARDYDAYFRLSGDALGRLALERRAGPE